jgi:hypothetical protein
MKTDLKSVLARCSSTLLQDTAGLASLVLMLIVGLNVSSLI